MTEMALWECKHCRKKFSKERIFMAHECTQMQRSKEIQTPVGAMAYGLYKYWLEKQKRKAPPVEGYISSSYYTGFIKFAQYVKETGVHDPHKYVELMLEAKISPTLWRRSEAYQIFLDYFDKRSSPYEQAATSVETITALAEGLEVAPGDVFKQLQVGDMLDMIQQKRLSPWLLFCSKSFKEWIGVQDPNDRALLMRSIGVDYWAVKLERQPEVVRELKEIAEALGI